MSHIAPNLLLAATLAVSLAAQAPTLVDSAGNPYPQGSVTVGGFNFSMSLAPNGNVFGALDPSLPTGYYAFDVLDTTFSPQSLLAPEDRVFFVQNNGAAGFDITRVSSTAGLPGEGVGLGGIGESFALSPYSSPNTPNNVCVLKCQLFSLGAAPTGAPLFLGFNYFRVGDGNPGSVSGVVFNDLNQDGDRDAGEPGLPGMTVKLVNSASTVMATTTTNAAGEYLFSPVGFDDCSVMLEFMSSMYTATTPVDVQLSNCGCGQQVVNFGLYRPMTTTCIGRTPGFWQNNNGVAIIQNGSFWDELVALNLVNANGSAFNPTGSVSEWRNWLRNRSAVNMAYMLAAHLAAMQLNVLSGSVDGNCWAQTGQGPMTISALMAAANEALGLDPFTPVGDVNRAAQELLKNALDAANNNMNWL